MLPGLSQQLYYVFKLFTKNNDGFIYSYCNPVTKYTLIKNS